MMVSDKTKVREQVTKDGILGRITTKMMGTGHGRSTMVGLALQALGALTLVALLITEREAILFLSLGAVLAGEIIFISSLHHRGPRAEGEQIR